MKKIIILAQFICAILSMDIYAQNQAPISNVELNGTIENISVSKSQPSIIYSDVKINNSYVTIRSNDNGKSWTNIPNPNFERIYEMNTHVSPINPEKIYKVGRFDYNRYDIIINSYNSGNSYYYNYFDGHEIENGMLFIDPSNDNILYAFDDLLGLLKSFDSGLTWKLIENGFEYNKEDEEYDTPTSVTIFQHNSNIVYSYSSEVIYKSLNGGLDWVKMLQTEYNSDYSYSLKNITVSNNDHNILYAVKHHYYINGKYCDIKCETIEVSSDSGKTWKNLSNKKFKSIYMDSSLTQTVILLLDGNDNVTILESNSNTNNFKEINLGKLKFKNELDYPKFMKIIANEKILVASEHEFKNISIHN